MLLYTNNLGYYGNCLTTKIYYILGAHLNINCTNNIIIIGFLHKLVFYRFQYFPVANFMGL